MITLKKVITYLLVLTLIIAASAAPFSNSTVSAKQIKRFHASLDRPADAAVSTEDTLPSNESSSSTDLLNSESPLEAADENDMTTVPTDNTSEPEEQVEEPDDNSSLEFEDEDGSTPSSKPDNLLDRVPSNEDGVEVVSNYAQLKSAIEYAFGDTTIAIDGNIDFESNPAIMISQNITLIPLNSHVTLTAKQSRHFIVSSFFMQASDITVSFDNITLDGGTTGGGIVIKPQLPPARANGYETIVEMNGAHIVNCYADAGGAIEIPTADGDNYRVELTLNDSDIAGNTARIGGGIYVGQLNNLTVENSTLRGNTASENGGAIYADSSWYDLDAFTSSLQLTGGVVLEGNTVAGNGGAVYTNPLVPLELEGEEIIIKNNTAGGCGGGIYFSGKYDAQEEEILDQYKDVPFRLTGLTISDNSAESDEYGGGGIFIERGYGTASITSCQINNNGAYDGAGVYAVSHSISDPENDTITLFETLVIRDSNIFSNEASHIGAGVYGTGNIDSYISNYYDNTSIDSGGAIYLSGSLNLNICQIYKNYAGSTGGGIFAPNYDTFVLHTIEKTNIQDNTAISYGGGINTDSNLKIISSEISKNVSIEGSGGAIHLRKNSLTVTDTTFVDNSALAGGGIHMHDLMGDSNQLIINESFFENNKAVVDTDGYYGNGGAVYYDGEGKVRISDTTFTKNTAQTDGGAVYYDGEGEVRISNTTLTKNTAQTDGGAICLNYYEDKLNLLFTDNVIFEYNHASVGYHSTLDETGDGAIHAANIKDTTYTKPFENAYNNYDVIYRIGDAVHYSTVFYHGNGHTSGTEPASQTVAMGTNFTVSGSGSLEKSGYRFSSWNTKSDGTGTSYSPNQSVQLAEDELHLYAVWRQSGGPGPGTTATDEPGGSTVEPGGSSEEPIDPTEDTGTTEDTEEPHIDYTYESDDDESDNEMIESEDPSSETSTQSGLNPNKKNPKTGTPLNTGALAGEFLLAISGLYICIKTSRKK